MALVNPYCTVAQVRAELRNTSSSIETTIEEVINAASRYIDEFKGRDYYLHDHLTDPLIIDADGQCVVDDWIFLPYRPVISVTEVRVGDEVWVENEDYRVKPDRIISLKGAWPKSNDPDCYIQIKGKFGYEQTGPADVPTGIPDNINKAAVLIAAALSGHNQKEIVALDGTRDSILDKNIPKTAMTLLGHGKVVI